MAMALVSAMMFTACDPDTKTPEGDTTKLWPAGVNGETLYGYINKSGDMVIKANYDRAYGFSCGWALVAEGSDKTYIDKNGKSAKVPDTDTYYTYFYHDYITFKEGGLFGKWDNNFVVAIPADYKAIGMTADNGYCFFSEDGKKYGFLDKNGKVVIADDYDYTATFDEGICVVGETKSDEMRYAVIDTKGNELIEMQKKNLYMLGDSRIAYYNDSKKKCGMWDKRGEEIGSTYDDIDPFTCGLALVEKNDKYGFIDKNGNEVIDLQYHAAMSLRIM